MWSLIIQQLCAWYLSQYRPRNPQFSLASQHPHPSLKTLGLSMRISTVTHFKKLVIVGMVISSFLYHIFWWKRTIINSETLLLFYVNISTLRGQYFNNHKCVKVTWRPMSLLHCYRKQVNKTSIHGMYFWGSLWFENKKKKCRCSLKIVQMTAFHNPSISKSWHFLPQNMLFFSILSIIIFLLNTRTRTHTHISIRPQLSGQLTGLQQCIQYVDVSVSIF